MTDIFKEFPEFKRRLAELKNSYRELIRPVNRLVGTTEVDYDSPIDESLFERFPQEASVDLRNAVLNDKQTGKLTREFGIHYWNIGIPWGVLDVLPKGAFFAHGYAITEDEIRANVRESGFAPASTKEAITFFEKLYCNNPDEFTEKVPWVVCLGKPGEYTRSIRPVISQEDGYPLFGYTRSCDRGLTFSLSSRMTENERTGLVLLVR